MHIPMMPGSARHMGAPAPASGAHAHRRRVLAGACVPISQGPLEVVCPCVQLHTPHMCVALTTHASGRTIIKRVWRLARRFPKP